jgi:hypothetical protein
MEEFGKNKEKWEKKRKDEKIKILGIPDPGMDPVASLMHVDLTAELCF